MPLAQRQRGELTPDSDAPIMRAQLRYVTRPYPQNGPGNDYRVRAVYQVDRITPTSKSCLLITQEYEFFKQRPGDRCEPTANLPCSRFYPKVSYEFIPTEGEVLESFNVGQRLHYRPDGVPESTIALLHDCDFPGVPQLCGSSFIRRHLPGEGFDNRANPLTMESAHRVVQHGQDTHQWDNVHQTWNDTVEEPNLQVGRLFGCPECVHTHWRWSASLNHFFFRDFGSGLPITGNSFHRQTNQNVDVGFVRYKPGEEHPDRDFTFLIDRNESIRNLVTRVTPGPAPFRIRYKVLAPADVVFWYSATSLEPISDLFFKHGSFFNPEFQTETNPALNATSGSAVTQDGPTSVTYGHIYQAGTTTFASVAANSLPPLPPGYVFLNNQGHTVTTEGAVSGPHVVAFGVPSVTDETVFNTLKIFHLEEDPFDPDAEVWVDQTILSPDPQAPNFASRTVNARVDDLGEFAIGRLVQPQPDPGVADLAITMSDSADPVVADNTLTYALNITNNGPQTGQNVGFLDALPADVDFVSVSPTQGSCKFHDGKVSCKLGTIANGGGASVSLVVRALEERSGMPANGKSIVNAALVVAENDDTNLENNSAVEITGVLPNPNAPPQVSITSPAGTIYTGVPTINVTATATDGEGALASVDFYDGGTLLGSGAPTGLPNQFRIGWNPGFGFHTLMAIATDLGGRSNSSEPVSILVNGLGSINITSPAPGSVVDPLSSITISAEASSPSSPITKVEFYANETYIGTGSLTGSSQYSITWNSIPTGAYSLRAALTDNSGALTTSLPVNLTASSRPSVAIVSPAAATSFTSSSRIVIVARVQDNGGVVSKVDFYANGSLIGSGSPNGPDDFTFDWMQMPNGNYSLMAVLTDNVGFSSTSAQVNIAVNAPGGAHGELVWFDDALPAGAVKHADGDVDWYWVDANPGPFLGARSHQSRNFPQQAAPNTTIHQHYFDGATQKLPVNAGDKLFTYLFLDVNNMPREIMLQWHDGNNWEHRAYWGQNRISWGTDGTDSRRYMGPIPTAGRWVRLEVPANLVGLEGATVSGMAFTLDAGRATWDLSGKTTSPAPPLPSPNDFVWVDDATPPGSILETIDDQWQWLPPHFSGTQGHRSYFTVNKGAGQFRSHSFRNAQTTMQVQPGDVLFTYVYVDGNNKPDEIVLQWHDGKSWEHRAFWGLNLYGSGTTGTEGRRYMGGLPAVNQWVRLEVPASYVGLEGKTVSGMAYGFYSKVDHAGLNWDYSGKSSRASLVSLPLSAITPIWQIPNGKYGAIYSTSDSGDSQLRKFYAHPNQAAGTVPFYRFRRPDSGNPEHFYSQCLSCYDGNGWRADGIAFYVYPEDSTPGTVPLYLYHDNSTHYFLTTDWNEAAAHHPDGTTPWAYVIAINPLVPAPPSNFYWDGVLHWNDNSATETEFRLERFDFLTNSWLLFATMPANTTVQKIGSQWPGYDFRVIASNSFGDSAPSNTGCTCFMDYLVVPNTPPEIYITSPLSDEVIDKDIAVSANVFDVDGAGTIAKVEFYADGNKLGESNEAPYWFVWNNAPVGLHSLTAAATDTAGGTIISSQVNVTVRSAPTVSITSPASGAVFDALATVTITTSASSPGASISKVEFFQSLTKLGETATAPYSFTWSNVAAGSYSLIAKVTDNLGATSLSDTINITVNNSNVPPAVSITAPTNGVVFTAPASISINAAASDSDGSVSKVDFFQGSTKLGEDTTAPYSFDWTNVPAGSYSLTARAIDNLGASSTSGAVNVTVNSNSPPTVGITAPTNGAAFTAPASFTISVSASDGDGFINKVEFFQGRSSWAKMSHLLTASIGRTLPRVATH